MVLDNPCEKAVQHPKRVITYRLRTTVWGSNEQDIWDAVWFHTSVILIFGRLRQENREINTSLDHGTGDTKILNMNGLFFIDKLSNKKTIHIMEYRNSLEIIWSTYSHIV